MLHITKRFLVFCFSLFKRCFLLVSIEIIFKCHQHNENVKQLNMISISQITTIFQFNFEFVMKVSWALKVVTNILESIYGCQCLGIRWRGQFLTSRLDKCTKAICDFFFVFFFGFFCWVKQGGLKLSSVSFVNLSSMVSIQWHQKVTTKSSTKTMYTKKLFTRDSVKSHSTVK